MCTEDTLVPGWEGAEALWEGGGPPAQCLVPIDWGPGRIAHWAPPPDWDGRETMAQHAERTGRVTIIETIQPGDRFRWVGVDLARRG